LNSPAEEWGPGFLNNDGAVGGTIFFGSSRSGGEGGRDIWHADEISTGAIERTDRAKPSFRVFPNPLVEETTISLGLAKPGRASVRIYDVRGRLVRTVSDEPMPAGKHRVVWDGTADRGHAVSAGIYLCRILEERNETVRKIVVTR
jgi:hypothetical protein